MGLERYGMSLMDGVYHEEQLACLEINGIRRYLTGLNEFAPEVKLLPDDQREAVIQDIRQTVAQLERELAANVVSVDDPEFWNKIKLLRPDNHEFWSKITVRCGNEPLFLDPAKDPYDLIKLRAIEAGGFSIVAKNLEDARNRPVAPKFFLDKVENTASTTTELKKLRNKALSELQKLFDKTPNKLFLVAKVVDINSAQYKKPLLPGRVDQPQLRDRPELGDRAALPLGGLSARRVHPRGIVDALLTLTPFSHTPLS